MSEVSQSAGRVVSISSAVEAPTPPAPSIQVDGLPVRLAGQRATFLGARSSLTYVPGAPPLAVLSLDRLRLLSELATKAEALLLALARSQQDLIGRDDSTGEETLLQLELTLRVATLNGALLSISFGDSLTLRQLAETVHGPRAHLWPQWLQDAGIERAQPGADLAQEV